jgi:hypothetical protein
MVEGVKLVFYKDPSIFYDPVGPGLYILLLAIFLLGASAAHFIISYKKASDTKKDVVVNKEMRIRMISTVINCAIYIFLISKFGYLVASLIFFLFQFRIQGIKSWFFNLILTFVITITYYFVFVKYCSLIFPRGLLEFCLDKLKL